MRLARRAAMESMCYPMVGAVISNKRPISFGYNKLKSHPVYANPSLTLRNTIHAEMDCTWGLIAEDMEGATMWVYREDRFGNPLLARPCENCLPILKYYDFDKIVYTVDKFPYYKIERLK